MRGRFSRQNSKQFVELLTSVHGEEDLTLNAENSDSAQAHSSAPPSHLEPRPEPKVESPLTPRPDAIDSPSPGLLDESRDLLQSHDEGIHILSHRTRTR